MTTVFCEMVDTWVGNAKNFLYVAMRAGNVNLFGITYPIEIAFTGE